MGKDMNPVILLHGLYDRARLFRHLAARLAADGRTAHAFDFVPNNGHARLEDLARQASDYIDARYPRSQPVDIVGFSMGGIVARYYVQRLGGLERTGHLITIGSPNQGTLMAHLVPRNGARQMRRGSEFIRDLNGDVARLSEIKTASIWTPYDFMIVPAGSARLPIGTTHRVDVAAHAWMPGDPRVLELVAKLLSE